MNPLTSQALEKWLSIKNETQPDSITPTRVGEAGELTCIVTESLIPADTSVSNKLVNESGLDSILQNMELGYFKPKSIDGDNGWIIIDYSADNWKPNYIVNAAADIPATALAYSEGVALVLNVPGQIDIYHSADSGATWTKVNTQPIEKGFTFQLWDEKTSFYWWEDTWNALNTTVDLSNYYTKEEVNALSRNFVEVSTPPAAANMEEGTFYYMPE